MFAIAVELLAGRYTATQFNDRFQPEWPPHPARLYSAMVAAWADSDEPDPAERAALEWLERQEAPEIHCGEGRQRSVVTHYVPVNDAAALQLLPGSRGRQGRAFPAVIPDSSAIWFVWPAAQPSDSGSRALGALLDRVGRLGHSSTLVACRSGETGPPSAPSWVPGEPDAGACRLRVPRAGSLARLVLAYRTHRGEEPRTLPAGMACYRRPGPARHTVRRPLLGGDWYVLGFAGPRFPAAVQALAVARAARSALLVHGDQPAPEVLSGHRREPGAVRAVRANGANGVDTADVADSADAEGTAPSPPLGRPHLAVVPLLNAGHPGGDGTVFGIALVLPAGASGEDRRAVENALRAWAAAGGREEFPVFLPAGPGGRASRYALTDLGVDRGMPGTEPDWLNSALTNRRRVTTRSYWCRPATHWVTVTPIALDRFPGNLRGASPEARDRAAAEAAAVIARACVHAGLAESAADVWVSVRLDAPLAGLPASPAGANSPGQRRFPGYQTGSGVPRACVHAEIWFPAPVLGPVLIGAGRYLGYGLCLPRAQTPEAE